MSATIVHSELTMHCGSICPTPSECPVLVHLTAELSISFLEHITARAYSCMKILDH